MTLQKNIKMKMKRFLNIISILLISFVLQSSKSTEVKIPDAIFIAIETGKVEQLSTYMNESVELIILDQEGIYSKKQANLILKDFYSKNTPKKFTLLHQGGSEKAKYAIGKLETQSTKYRIHFLVKITDGKSLIHQLRIQIEDNEE